MLLLGVCVYLFHPLVPLVRDRGIVLGGVVLGVVECLTWALVYIVVNETGILFTLVADVVIALVFTRLKRGVGLGFVWLMCVGWGVLSSLLRLSKVLFGVVRDRLGE